MKSSFPQRQGCYSSSKEVYIHLEKSVIKPDVCALIGKPLFEKVYNIYTNILI
jgi:hypothetical protein